MSKPVLQALVLAEHVYQDKRTGNWIIAGTFNRLCILRRTAPQENILHTPEEMKQIGEGFRKLHQAEIHKVGSPWVYISLTEVYGTVPLELRYVDLSNSAVMLRVEFSARASSPLETIQMGVLLPPLPAPHPGVYALELLSRDDLIGSHRITVVESPAPEPQVEEGQP